MIILLFFICSFVLTYYVIPKIIGVLEYKNILEEPNHRSSHKITTPTLGGVAFYITIMISLFFLRDVDYHKLTYYIIPGLTILFIVGLKDDLVVLSPLSKLLAQLTSIGFVLLSSEFQITSLNGFLGIHEIPLYASIFISGFLMVLIINSYNLIDGIDGLASAIGILILGMYLIIFYYLNIDFFVFLAVIVIGVLVAFLRFNLSKTKKIFMGDTGSLIIGFIISIFTIKFLTLKNHIESTDFPLLIENLPLVAFAILALPLFDATRVFVIRIFNKRSPFSADRNHIHHILLNLGFSHLKSTIILTISNLLFVILFLYLACNSKQYFLISISLIILVFVLYIFNKLNSKK